MDKTLEAIGAIMIFAALVVAGITLVSGSSLDIATSVVAAVTWSGPVFVAGLLIAAFGNMLGHMKAMRSALEQMAKTNHQV